MLVQKLLVLALVLSASGECPNQPYSHCNLGKEGFINVHLVPHTHVGLKKPNIAIYNIQILLNFI